MTAETPPFVMLTQQQFIVMANMPRRTCSRLAKEGRIPGTAGRAEGRHSDPWPIPLTPELKQYIQERLDTLRRQKVIAERKALAQQTGASLAPITAIVDGADAVRVGLWTMMTRRTIDRLSGRELMRLEKTLRDPARSLYDIHNALLSRMASAGITPLG
ncbi:hypothetical protein [Roseimicrobium gellanilyticum]|nr:hypothetical protein [Roseimicrobium gellanilyticum]